MGIPYGRYCEVPIQLARKPVTPYLEEEPAEPEGAAGLGGGRGVPRGARHGDSMTVDATPLGDSPGPDRLPFAPAGQEPRPPAEPAAPLSAHALPLALASRIAARRREPWKPAVLRLLDRGLAPATAPGGRPPRGRGHRRAVEYPGLRHLARVVRAEGRRVERDRRRAGRLFEVLMAAAPADRAELLAADRRFGSRGLAERLLASAGAAARNRPAEAGQLCELALAVIARLDAERTGAGAITALRLAARARRAEALWWGRDYAAAEASLAAALDDVDATPIGEVERALYCRVLALVRAGQGRFDEALALLARAALICRDQEEHQELAAALVERGWLLAEEDPPSARLTFRRALDFVDPAAQPWLALRLRQGLALCAAEMAHAAEAKAELRQARALAGGVEGEADRLRCAWTEARIEARIGQPEQAMAALPLIIEGWLAREEAYLAALAAVDLAELYLTEARWPGLSELEQLLPRLGMAGLATEPTLAMRAVLQLVRLEGFAGQVGQGMHEPAALYLLEYLRRYLWRARHQPGLAYVPCRKAIRVIGWDALPFEERLNICQRVEVAARVAALPVAAVPDDLRTLLTISHQEANAVRIEWDGLDEARVRLRRSLATLRQVRRDLREIAASIPQPPESEIQQILAREGEPSAAVLISGALDHLDAAYLEPAIRDLADATDSGRPGVVR
jgi:hypothetical protein